MLPFSPGTPGSGTESESAEVHHLNGTGSDASLHALPDSSQEEFSSGRQEKGKSYQVRQNSGGEEEGASQEDGQAVKESRAGKLAAGQLPLNPPEGPQTFKASQGGPGEAGEDHQADGGPEAHDPAHLDQDEELQERYPHKEEGQSGEYRHVLKIQSSGRCCTPRRLVPGGGAFPFRHPETSRIGEQGGFAGVSVRHS